MREPKVHEGRAERGPDAVAVRDRGDSARALAPTAVVRKSVGVALLGVVVVMAAAGIRPASGQDADVTVPTSGGHTLPGGSASSALAVGFGQGAASPSEFTPRRVLPGLAPTPLSVAFSPRGWRLGATDTDYGAVWLLAVTPSIRSFSAGPTRLSSSGGKVELEAVVRGAAECRSSGVADRAVSRCAGRPDRGLCQRHQLDLDAYDHGLDAGLGVQY